jgi:hypothetical protein
MSRATPLLTSDSVSILSISHLILSKSASFKSLTLNSGSTLEAARIFAEVVFQIHTMYVSEIKTFLLSGIFTQAIRAIFIIY